MDSQYLKHSVGPTLVAALSALMQHTLPPAAEPQHVAKTPRTVTPQHQQSQQANANASSRATSSDTATSGVPHPSCVTDPILFVGRYLLHSEATKFNEAALKAKETEVKMLLESIERYERTIRDSKRRVFDQVVRGHTLHSASSRESRFRPSQAGGGQEASVIGETAVKAAGGEETAAKVVATAASFKDERFIAASEAAAVPEGGTSTTAASDEEAVPSVPPTEDASGAAAE